MLAEARAQKALAPDNHPQVQRLRAIAGASFRMPRNGTTACGAGAGRST
jgi:Fe-S oxidoreductase